MVDTYGGSTSPIARSTSGEDFVTYYVGEFLKAVSNAYGAIEWQNLKPGPTAPLPIRKAFGTDPAVGSFNENDLPALFVFKPEGAKRHRRQLAEDIRVEEGPLHCLWVPNPAIQVDRAKRAAFGWKLMKLWDIAVERERDPNFIVAGDEYPSPTAVQKSGSYLAQFAPVRVLWMTDVQMIKLQIKAGSATRTYEAFLTIAELQEQLIVDPATRYDPMGGLTQTTTTDPSDPLGPLVTGTMQLP